jgi:hypothetical protein
MPRLRGKAEGKDKMDSSKRRAHGSFGWDVESVDEAKGVDREHGSARPVRRKSTAPRM